MTKLYLPGDVTTIWVSAGHRPATVLAVIDQQVLVEYVMPSGVTGLRFLRPPFTNSSRVNYRALSRDWLQAIVNAHGQWLGRPFVRADHAPVPSPQTLLQQKKLLK